MTRAIYIENDNICIECGTDIMYYPMYIYKKEKDENGNTYIKKIKNDKIDLEKILEEMKNLCYNKNNSLNPSI